MTTRLIKWGAIAALIVAVAWISYQWGASAAREAAAEARSEAVAEARAEAEAKYAEDLERQRVRARAAAERNENLQRKLRKETQRAEQYASSVVGQQECFGPEGVEQWNEY